MLTDNDLKDLIQRIMDAYVALAALVEPSLVQDPHLTAQRDMKDLFSFWLLQDRVGMQAEVAFAGECEAIIEHIMGNRMPFEHQVTMAINARRHWLQNTPPHEDVMLPELTGITWYQHLKDRPEALSARAAYKDSMQHLIDELVLRDGNLTSRDITVAKALEKLFR